MSRFGELAQYRDQLVTNPIAQIRRIQVRRVLNRVQTEHLNTSCGFGASQGENRVAGARAHRASPSVAAHGAVDEDRLGLVVGGVTGSGAYRQGTKPRSTRPRSRLGPARRSTR